MKPRKVRGRSTSPEGRAVLHQAVDKIFVCGQEFRWAEERLCTTEDSQSATGFGGQVGDVTFPGKIMADSEAQDVFRISLVLCNYSLVIILHICLSHIWWPSSSLRYLRDVSFSSFCIVVVPSIFMLSVFIGLPNTNVHLTQLSRPNYI